MQRHRHTLKTGALLAVVGLALTGSGAWAGPKLFTSQGGFTFLNGSVETNSNGNVDPFTLQIFSSGNECLRLAVTSQGADLEMTLVAPSGRVWQDDDSNGALRPLIKAITTTRGWYPVILSRYNGAATNADFTLSYGRFASTSAQCAGPTAPRIPLEADEADHKAAKAPEGVTGRAPAHGPNAGD